LTARPALLGLALVLLACARPGSGSAPAATAAPSGPRAVLPSGAAFRLELATTDADRAQGLMFRESLPEGVGMLFLFDGAAIRPFWMRNCHFPLDIVHLTKDGTVVDVLEIGRAHV
jgi:hypothetical protein